MGTIVCQSCEDIIDFFESEKSVVLYGISQGSCSCDKDNKENA